MKKNQFAHHHGQNTNVLQSLDQNNSSIHGGFEKRRSHLLQQSNIPQVTQAPAIINSEMQK